MTIVVIFKIFKITHDKILKLIIKRNIILYSLVKFFLFFLNYIKKLTSYGRSYFVQLRYKKLILKKKKIFLSNKKIKVAFFITQKQLWCHQSIYDNLLKSNKFEPVVVVFPNAH